MDFNIITKITSITFAIWVMFTAMGWLGFKKNIKSYIILWIGIIPLIICNIFLFINVNYINKHQINILIISMFSFLYIIFLFFYYKKFLVRN